MVDGGRNIPVDYFYGDEKEWNNLQSGMKKKLQRKVFYLKW